jgi:hypothetical protein
VPPRMIPALYGKSVTIDSAIAEDRAGRAIASF